MTKSRFYPTPEVGRQIMITSSFWKDVLNRLPPQVRHRYARDFEMAERREHALDVGIEAWRFAKQAFASGLHAMARGFRSAARSVSRTQ